MRSAYSALILGLAIVKGIKKSSAIGGLKMHVPVPVSDLLDTSTGMDSSGKL
jgi:hypothetical protein